MTTVKPLCHVRGIFFLAWLVKYDHLVMLAGLDVLAGRKNVITNIWCSLERKYQAIWRHKKVIQMKRS